MPERVRALRADKKHRKDETFEYRLLMSLAYTVFLVGAVVRRLAHPTRTRRVPGSQRRQSVFGEARAQADTCVPFAFMG